MTNRIETGRSALESVSTRGVEVKRLREGRRPSAEVEDIARVEAEDWFQGLLAEVREFEEEGKAKRIIRRHLLGDYIGDIWNTVSGAYVFLQSSPDVQEEFLAEKAEKREDFLERKRLTFIYGLETVNREEIAPYVPKKAGERLSQLANYVRENEWNEVQSIEKLIDKKEEIREFVSKFFDRHPNRGERGFGSPRRGEYPIITIILFTKIIG